MRLGLLLSAWGDYFTTIFGEDVETEGGPVWVAEQIFETVEIVLWILIGVVGLAGMIYAIYLGIQLARAEDQSKRDDAKKHLITVLIALVVTLVLVVFFLYLLPLILKAFAGDQGVNIPNKDETTKP